MNIAPAPRESARARYYPAGSREGCRLTVPPLCASLLYTQALTGSALHRTLFATSFEYSARQMGIGL